MNMSYCQFRNTVEALEQVIDTLHEANDFEELCEDMCREEEINVRNLIELCQSISEDFGQDSEFLPND